MKTLPKSLHTVTVLVHVARTIAALDGRRPSPEDITTAAAALGYPFADDPYGLRDKARAILAKEIQS